SAPGRQEHLSNASAPWLPSKVRDSDAEPKNHINKGDLDGVNEKHHRFWGVFLIFPALTLPCSQIV
ncbi:MAG: hypothetical protein ACKPGK_05310, partial [Verrucomicrobiota bacterium]